MRPKGHANPFEQAILGGDTQDVLCAGRAAYIMETSFDVHGRQYSGSRTGIQHLALVSKEIVDFRGMRVQVDCIIAHTE